MSIAVSPAVSSPLSALLATSAAGGDFSLSIVTTTLEASTSATFALDSALTAELVTFEDAIAAAISSFRTWKADYLTQDIPTDRRRAVETYSTAFEVIITKAVEKNGYANPQAFVSSLSVNELAALQHIHGLPEPINPAKLSRQEAFNLLQPPGRGEAAAVNGTPGAGGGLSLRSFPPPGAPEGVTLAWNKAIAGMDPGDVMALEASMIPVALAAGAMDGDPGDLAGDLDYLLLAKSMIDALNTAKTGQNFWQQVASERYLDGLQKFMNALAAAPLISLWFRRSAGRMGTAHMLRGCRRLGARECMRGPHEECPAQSMGPCSFV